MRERKGSEADDDGATHALNLCLLLCAADGTNLKAMFAVRPPCRPRGVDLVEQQQPGCGKGGGGVEGHRAVSDRG